MIIIPDPLIFGKPLHVWLGIVLTVLVILQILIGKRILKIDFWYHRNVIPWLILAVLSLHAWYGFQIYFLK